MCHCPCSIKRIITFALYFKTKYRIKTTRRGGGNDDKSTKVVVDNVASMVTVVEVTRVPVPVVGKIVDVLVTFHTNEAPQYST